MDKIIHTYVATVIDSIYSDKKGEKVMLQVFESESGKYYIHISSGRKMKEIKKENILSIS